MLSFTQEDRDALHQAGITAELHSPQPQLMSLDEVLQNKFALLNDYPQMGFYFIRFPDELVPMQQQGQHFQCFGKCCYGYFVLNVKGNVYLLSTNNDYTDASVVWVNHSLDEFIKSYSLLLAGVFQLKGSDTSTRLVFYRLPRNILYQRRKEKSIIICQLKIPLCKNTRNYFHPQKTTIAI